MRDMSHSGRQVRQLRKPVPLSGSVMAGSSGQSEQLASVLTADLLSIELADLAIVKPAGGVFKAFEGIIDGVQDAVAANLQHGREQGRGPKVSASCDIDVLAKIIPERALAWDAAWRLLDDVVDSPNVERNAFPEVTEDHLQIRVAIEQSR